MRNLSGVVWSSGCSTDLLTYDCWLGIMLHRCHPGIPARSSKMVRQLRRQRRRLLLVLHRNCLHEVRAHVVCLLVLLARRRRSTGKERENLGIASYHHCRSLYLRDITDQTLLLLFVCSPSSFHDLPSQADDDLPPFFSLRIISTAKLMAYCIILSFTDPFSFA